MRKVVLKSARNVSGVRVETRLAGQLALRGLSDAGILRLGPRETIVYRHPNVGGFDVVVNDPLLVRVLDGVANLDEQIEPLFRGAMSLVAVIGDPDASHRFHDEVESAGLGRPRIQHLGNVRMIHHRQRLPFRLEPDDDLHGVHTQLDDLQRDAPAHWFGLFSHLAHAAAAIAGGGVCHGLMLNSFARIHFAKDPEIQEKRRP